MIEIEAVQQYARERRLTERDAAQTFLQAVVLRNLSLAEARLIGGTALVLGHQNPRFSEDLDLTQVQDPGRLKPGLSKAASEIELWFQAKVILLPPKGNGRTWRLTCRLGRSESLQLHVDSQPYAAFTGHPVVVQYPSIPPFVFPSVELDEILADKIIAVAGRRYLGGRDLFDLWFHWLRFDGWKSRLEKIEGYLDRRLPERGLVRPEIIRLLAGRLSHPRSTERARAEWARYLPQEFQNETVLRDILRACAELPGVFR